MNRNRNTLKSFPLTEPGWYLDPITHTGTRYFDGHQWTLDTRDVIQKEPANIVFPGWYVDPKNNKLLRYFDGSNWTDNTTSPEVVRKAQSKTLFKRLLKEMKK